MAQTLSPFAQTFVPHVEPNPQLEYDDSFLEYAYANGLWGLHGANVQPSKDDIDNMIKQFADHWINIHGYNENINYYGQGIEEYSEEELSVFDEDEEEQDYIEAPQEEVPPQQQCEECQATGLPLYECPEDMHDYCGDCWERYSTDLNSPRTWSDIAIDFQDFAEYRFLLPVDSHYTEYERIWEIYVNECWHPLTRNLVHQLAIANNWNGILTPEAIEERYYDEQRQQELENYLY